MGAAMHLLNFAHPLTAEQLRGVEQLTAARVERVIEARVQFDQQRLFAEQAADLLDGLDISPLEWQTLRWLVNPPSLAPISCTILSELHGRMGYFPPILRLGPVAGAVPPQFEPAEVIDLQALREAARAKR
jgi:hypothetical protein